MPRKLTEEEFRNPLAAIASFFDYAHLPEVRELFWLLLKTTVTGSYSTLLTNSERSDLLLFFEQLEKLIEATHLLHAKK